MTLFKKITETNILYTNKLERFSGKNYADKRKLKRFEDGMKIDSTRELILTLWADDHTEFQFCFFSKVEISYIDAKKVTLIERNNSVIIDTILFGEGFDGEPDTDDFEDDSLTIWFHCDLQRDTLKNKFFMGKNGKMVKVKFIMPTGDLLKFRGILNGEF